MFSCKWLFVWKFDFPKITLDSLMLWAGLYNITFECCLYIIKQWIYIYIYINNFCAVPTPPLCLPQPFVWTPIHSSDTLKAAYICFFTHFLSKMALKWKTLLSNVTVINSCSKVVQQRTTFRQFQRKMAENYNLKEL